MRSLREASLPADTRQPAALLLNCIDFITDTVLITEAEPVDLPGPRVIFVNPAFERMTGYRADEVIGQTPRLMQGPKTDRAELRRIRTELLNWHPIRAELVNYKKNGDEFFVEMDIVPIRDTSGRWTHWVSIQRDVTARKKAEAEALTRESQRYESLGTLSSGIAHDFNNIIAAILGNVAIGSLDMQAGRMPHASVAQIKTAALRARSVVAKILAYARRSSEATVALELAPVVREATDLLRAILPSSVRLEVNYPPVPLRVRGDTTQLCQVLLNLGINALQALEGREGRIRFGLEAARRAPNAALPATGGMASIEVSDTGCGMDAATQARMFEPYFTTKENGRGTGLGLSVVWGIVTAHGGSVRVDSTVGRGSRIGLSLPLLPDEPADPPTRPEAVQAPAATFGKGEHVLVVDDDEMVVVVLEGMLKRWGFRVTTLQDPLQAVTLVQALPDEFDVVVTDLNMPNVSGLQLAREVLAIRHDLPVLLGSGNVSESLVAEAQEAGIAAVFPKEFAVEQLGGLLRATLSRPLVEPTPDHPTVVSPHREFSMQNFLTNNRDELVTRCKSKVALRARRGATDVQLPNGVPLLLEQLIQTLSAEDAGEPKTSLLISGPAGGDRGLHSDIGVGATAHGRQLLDLGYTVDQVVHDYGDLCQAITDLAVERDAPFSVDAYRTLNRCLDNAIANAVTEFAAQRDVVIGAAHAAEENQRLGFLAHELRNYLNVAVLAFDALEGGGLPIAGSTGAVLKRNLYRLAEVIGQTLLEVRCAAMPANPLQVFALAPFIADAASLASLYAQETGCTLSVPAVDPQLALRGNRERLLAALGNLLQNAFKFTRPNSEVTLQVHAREGRVSIDVGDHCGGLPPGTAEKLFKPFSQASEDARGLGLGLSIAAQGVTAAGGFLSVQDLPGVGCVFRIDLPAESTGDSD